MKPLPPETRTAEVIGLPTAERELYVDRHELARLMGISVSTVDRLRARGMPSVIWGDRSRRFRPSVALAWARAQHGDEGRSAA